ncbi:Acyl-CoA dehydrogenase [Nakamurella panacisegetis]|uniref:Acyl-CoA dehydrogenase n=1 Tax=Nakamurella panacisegetis TaxID=1090615 RepID=A0A1H0LBC0_9ACTN|nr:acyl-CoA dehydrogenase family protein [Nakamurella panacisegetis]SDO65549.1 Acyl-CoA dehydrogenase [Nakamurella panacisegetis]
MTPRAALRPTSLTESERALQQQVRRWLADRLPVGSHPPGLGMAAAADPVFSADLGAQGWLGMSLPPEYGGGGRTAVERQIVVEELLSRGAPVAYHWVADRQSGPSIAAVGSEEQKATYLPGIARGEFCFAIGMSEPGAGSDLAAVRARAVPADGGWRIDGTKIWTSGAAWATHILGLFRTSDDRHGGLTQFIVDTRTPGVGIAPITFIDGSKDFCEVTFDNVVLPSSAVLGEVGGGWGQNTGELALERGGVDRWLSPAVLVDEWAAQPDADSRELALAAASLWAFRGMSLSIARMVDTGQRPVQLAALVKEMATRFEQDTVEAVSRWQGRLPDPDEPAGLLSRAVLAAPSWTIRGGTTEILRTVIAKGMIRDVHR